MSILNKENTKPVIDLTSSSGNAFALLGYANDLCKQLGFSCQKAGNIQQEMMASDYNNLIVVFDKYFGEYVDLIK